MFTHALESGIEYPVLRLMSVMAIGHIKSADRYFMGSIWSMPLLRLTEFECLLINYILQVSTAIG